MAIAVVSNNVSCDSAEKLASELKCDFINLQNSEKRTFPEYTHIFKYGFSGKIAANSVFNTHKATIRAINKLKTFKALSKSDITIDYTTNFEKAIEWLNEGFIVVARQTATGANGEGLQYCTTLEELTNAQGTFWTKYFPHTNEFRVNMWKGNVVSIYDKTRRPSGNFKFSLWIGQEKHPQLVKIASEIWKNIKLDWCGVDILRDTEGNLKVLEVNSAPVLYPFTIKKLCKLITKEIQNA